MCKIIEGPMEETVVYTPTFKFKKKGQLKLSPDLRDIAEAYIKRKLVEAGNKSVLFQAK